MVSAIATDLGAEIRGDALPFVNGFGGMPAMELYLTHKAARRFLKKLGARVIRSLVGDYVASLEMASCSITASVLEGDHVALWDAPVESAALR